MKDIVARHAVTITLGLAGLVVVSLVLNAFLLVRVSSLDEEMLQTRDDLARVEIGAGLFASEVTGLQNQLGELAPQVGRGLEEAVAGLESFRSSTISFEVPINENIPLEAEIVLERTLTVPIQTVFRVDETVDTTITIQGPFGTEIPLDVTVPVQLEIPVDLEVPVAVNETIPVAAEVPVRLSVPISVEVEGTELAALADSLGRGLAAFGDLIAGFE